MTVGGRVNRGGNIESWSNLLCGQPKNKFQAKKIAKISHFQDFTNKKERTNGAFNYAAPRPKKTPIALKKIRSAQQLRIDR
jgi:hypothetical protein